MEDMASTSPVQARDGIPSERVEDLHKPSIVAFQALIDTFVRARQLKWAF